MTHQPAPRPDDGDAIRASDADRDAVADVLSTALSEGRLDLTEYEQRLDLAMNATTRGELVPLTADLPAPTKPDAADEVAERTTDEASLGRWREYVNEWRYWLGGAIIMIGIWAVTSVRSGDFGNFWPAIPLGIWAAVLIAGLVWPDDKEKKKAKDDDWDL